MKYEHMSTMYACVVPVSDQGMINEVKVWLQVIARYIALTIHENRLRDISGYVARHFHLPDCCFTTRQALAAEKAAIDFVNSRRPPAADADGR